jgi:3-phenylpropionate/trans-cinnamate dioxygenase ferredoxin reductase component
MNAIAEVAVIGAGEVGARSALALRRLGFAGSIALIGEDPLEPYELPPLSKDFITSEEAPRTKTIASLADFAAAQIDYRRGVAARALDRGQKRIVLSNGETMGYGRLLIASGSSPRRLAIPGIAPDEVHVLRNAAEALALRDAFRPGRKVAVIGGGFIGLELASSARKRGAHVSVIEGLDRILKRGVPAEIASVVEARHRQAGVDFHVNTSILSGETRAGRHYLKLSDGTMLEADVIVVGIGAVPNTGLAEAAGLAIENGIRVDDQFRTSDPDIFAAGDCANFPHPVYGGRRLRLESWRAAVEHAAHVARAMMGETVRYDAAPWFWSDQYDLVLQVAGLIDEGETTIRRPIGGETFLLGHFAADGRIVAASGIGPGDSVARDLRLAEMMIQRSMTPDPAIFADPAASLKTLLKPK